MKYQFNEKEHLHTLDGKPLTGTSSVMDIVSKPLTWWAVGEGLKLLGWTPITELKKGKRVAVPKNNRFRAIIERFKAIQELDSEEFLALLDQAYVAHTKTLKKSATKGKDLHALLERYVKHCIKKNEGAPANLKNEDIQDFIDWADENVDTFLWSELHTYSEEFWLGGVTDAGAKLKDGSIAIIDFKSSKAAYPTHFWQIGGYNIQLEENGGFDAEGNKVMEPVKVDTHIVIPFGAEEFTVSKIGGKAGVENNKKSFRAALWLYRQDKELNP